MTSSTCAEWPGAGLGGVAAGVVEYRRLAYRALVLQATAGEFAVVWEYAGEDDVDLVGMAARCGCAGPVEQVCRHWWICLAVAVWLDDPRPWVAGVSRVDRVILFDQLAQIAVRVEPWISPTRRRNG